MPRVPLIYTEIFYEPLTEDVEELLALFQQTDSVRFQDFSAVWRQMSFSDVFLGVTSMSEMKRFCRVALATAMKYFLPPYSFQVRVGGLYLLFAFYHTQLAVPHVQIRLALKDLDAVQRFLKDSVDAGHYDVVYIFQKLVSSKALHYTAMPHFLTFQKQRKPEKKQVSVQMVARATAVRELLSEDLLEELANIQSHYEKMKADAAEVSRQATMTHQDFTAQLRRCLSEFVSWQQKAFFQEDRQSTEDDDDDAEDGEKPVESGSSRARLLSSIKQKSFASVQAASKSRRHRQAEAVDEQTPPAARQRKRPVSLRSRTWKSLEVAPDKSNLQAWLLSAPEREHVPIKRSYRARFMP
ncbi:snRNA-activating protein complex subunit 1-like [Aulostomus maculatus]